MVRTFKGVFDGGKFTGRYIGREGYITCEDDGKRLRIWWELVGGGISVDGIPCSWKIPLGEPIAERHQRDILECLSEWFRVQGIPSNLTSDPWVNAADDISNVCAWAKCDRPSVIGYSVCRWHILKGYLYERPTQPV
jgi:hypothetical protein